MNMSFLTHYHKFRVSSAAAMVCLASENHVPSHQYIIPARALVGYPFKLHVAFAHLQQKITGDLTGTLTSVLIAFHRYPLQRYAKTLVVQWKYIAPHSFIH